MIVDVSVERDEVHGQKTSKSGSNLFFIVLTKPGPY